MNDPTRGAIGELFGVWWKRHGPDPVSANELHPEVRKIANPGDRPRQWLTAYLDNLHRTRVAEFMFERKKEDNWRPATYTLMRVD